MTRLRKWEAKALISKPILKRLKYTLDRLAPIVNDIEQLSKQLDSPEAETKGLIEEMKKGAKLVRKCLKIRLWNYVYYSNKLNKLDETILRFFQVDLQVQNTRNGLQVKNTRNGLRVKNTRNGLRVQNTRNGLRVKNTRNGLRVQNTRNGLQVQNTRNWLQVQNTRFGLLPTISETRGLSGVTPGVSCAVSKTREFIVGLDMPLKELKTLLLKEEVQLLLLTAPGGCGKTTLVQMLCQDEQIQGTSIYFIFFCVIVCLRGRVCDFTFKKV
jgi:hypothetical protein